MQEYAADFLNCDNNPKSILCSMEKLEEQDRK